MVSGRKRTRDAILVLMLAGCASCLASARARAADVTAKRFAENPLVTVRSDPSVGDNVNGPSIIKVPDWVQNPLGRYYMYFAHHRGTYIRLAYANSLHGPWKIYVPGVLNVSETALFRPQPDPPYEIYGVYTHVASPEVLIDDAHKRIIMWVHGQFSDGKKWPDDPIEAHAWLRQNGYSQITQVTVSTDGLHFEARPAMSREPYLRVFEHGGEYYGIVRLGHLVHSKDPLEPFESGPDPFRDTPFSNKVRHVALLADGDTLHIFLSVIGAAPESIVHTTMSLKGDWQDWKVGAFDEVLKPEARYECPDWPVRPSEVGEIYGAARQLRDPALYVEKGADGKDKITLFYTICGEQGVAAADLEMSGQ
jgi:hypothetical protein